MNAHLQIVPNTGAEPVNVVARQAPLRELYVKQPSAAWTVDHAHTSGAVALDDPLRSSVSCGAAAPVEIPVAVDPSVGGEGDAPVPGDILAAAIASCLDTAIRMIANIMKVRLTRLEVSVDVRVDVRGTLRMKRRTPVGFQHIDVLVEIAAAPEVSDDQIERLLEAAECSCVVLQTLRNPASIRITPVVA